MALTKDYTYKEIYININDETKTMEIPKTVPNAYIKINAVDGNKHCINIIVGIYEKDKITFVHNELYSFEPSLEENSSNFIKQGYEYLKSLDGYVEAVDC